jgi:excisionase family DNA binding protein
MEVIMDIPRLLRIKDAAKILGVRPRTLYQWKWRGSDLPFTKIGRSLRISEDDLLAFINQGQVSGAIEEGMK